MSGATVTTLYPSLQTGINGTIEAARGLHRARQPTTPHQRSTTDHPMSLTVLGDVVTSPGRFRGRAPEPPPTLAANG